MLLNSANLSQAEKQVIIIINYTALFLLAYFTSNITYIAATTLAAVYGNIPVEIFPSHINFKIFSHQWTRNDVISTFSAGPVACLLLGAVFFSQFNRVKAQRGYLKVYLLWGFLHAFNFFLGSIIAGTIVKAGFWYAIMYVVSSEGIPMMLAVVALVILIGIGIAASPGFLYACDSKTLMRFSNREKMLISTVFLPWLLGSFILLGIKYSDFQLYEILQFITLGLVLIPVYIMNQNVLFSQIVRDPLKTEIAWHLLIGIGIVAALFVLLLHKGLSIS